MLRAWWLVIAACSSPGNATGDGGVAPDSTAPDSTGDASTSIGDASIGDAPASHACNPSTPPGPVRVHRNFVTILTHGSDGSFLGRVVVGATPLFTDVDVPGCGAVTIVFDHRGYETITSVEPGDELFDTPPSAGNVHTASVVIDSPLPDATMYRASAGSRCQGGSTSVGLSVPYSDDCIGPDGNSTVMVWPEPTIGLRYAVFENGPLVDTQNTPLHVTSWRTDAPLHHMRFELDQVADSVACYASSIARSLDFFGAAVSGASAVTTHDFDLKFPEFGDAANYGCDVVHGINHRSYIARVPAPMPAAITLTEEQLLPRITGIELDADLLRPTVTLSTEPATSDEDFAIMSLTGTTSAHGDIANWRIIVPPGTRAFRVPELPADFQIGFGVAFSGVSAALAESTDLVDYRQARQECFRIINVPARRPVGVVVRTTTMYSGGL
jgi:hypothetical protein